MVTSDTHTYRFETDILYRDATAGALTDYQKERYRLDVYYPENRAGFPTVVWFHGGGLSSGERAVPETLKTRASPSSP